jgi:hypothetical protein
MHIELGTALVVAALAASLVLVADRVGRLFAGIAVIATGLELLIALGWIELSVGKLRLDVILPALVVVGGAGCWARSSAKSGTTAATVLLAAGAIQLLSALHILV